MAYDSRVAALASGLDDPGNASGGGAGAIREGVVYAHLWAGVTRGSGQTQAVQTATAAGLQAAMNYAAANKYKIKVLGYYEIYSSTGLMGPLTANFQWEGTLDTTIKQFYVNAPCLTIGDTTGANQAGAQRWSGFCLDYGVSQTGQTGANLLTIGSAAFCTIEQFNLCIYYGSNPPWIAFNVTGSTSCTFFQNTIRDGNIGGAQQSLLNRGTGGTGNQWANIYAHAGSSNTTRTTLSGPALNLAPNNQTSDDVYTRINAEHCNTPNIINAVGAVSSKFDGFHVEDVVITGSYAAAIAINGGELKFTTSLMLDLQYASTATNCRFLALGNSGEVVDFDFLKFKWSSYDTAGLGQTVTLVSVSSYQGTDVSDAIRISKLSIEDDPGGNAKYLTLDPNMPGLPFSPSTFIEEYIYDNLLPRTVRAKPVVTAAYTHYGQHAEAVIFVPATVPAGFSVSLSNKFKASGTGSSLPTPGGSRVRVRRQSGSPATVYAVPVVDTASGTTLSPGAATGTDAIYSFGGTSWALVP